MDFLHVAEPVVLLSRRGCHLCEEARIIVERVCVQAKVGWCEVDVDVDPGLVRQFGEMVPVVLVDGVQHGFWKIDEERLRALLSRRVPQDLP